MKPTTGTLTQRYARGLRACLAGSGAAPAGAGVFENNAHRAARRRIAVAHVALCPRIIPPTRRAAQRAIYDRRAADYLLGALAAQAPPARRGRPAGSPDLAREIARRRTVEQALRDSRRTQRQSLAEAELAQQQVRRLAHRLIRAQEEERKEISRELHDEIVQTLATVNVQLSLLKVEARSHSADTRRNINRTQRLVKKSVRIVYRFARELRPTLLDDLGLAAALQNVAREIARRSGIDVQVRMQGAVSGLPEDVRIVVYRVAQAALNNVARHSGATKVKVRVRCAAGALLLEVSDNGTSFDVARVMRPHKNQRLGLVGMRERVEMLNGTFTVESSTGRGTTVRARIPLPLPAGQRRRPHS